jgi:L-lysine exporter family protein LysE/ArgO
MYMASPFLTGFFLGISLIVAIGAQNAFVLKQGILRQHVFYVALFCSISDSLLICFGIYGISYLFNDFINEFSNIIFILSALWLFSYGILRLFSALKSNMKVLLINSESNSLFGTISVIAVFTFANPHVYLDTVVLIGSISQQFSDFNKLYFALGACSASFVWFFALAYGAKLLNPILQKTSHWRILELVIALIMFYIAINLLNSVGLL